MSAPARFTSDDGLWRVTQQRHAGRDCLRVERRGICAAGATWYLEGTAFTMAELTAILPVPLGQLTEVTP